MLEPNISASISNRCIKLRL